MTEFGLHLKQARERRGLSLRQIAAVIALCRGIIARRGIKRERVLATTTLGGIGGVDATNALVATLGEEGIAVVPRSGPVIRRPAAARA